jgi:hypothetical protein
MLRADHGGDPGVGGGGAVIARSAITAAGSRQLAEGTRHYALSTRHRRVTRRRGEKRAGVRRKKIQIPCGSGFPAAILRLERFESF